MHVCDSKLGTSKRELSNIDSLIRFEKNKFRFCTVLIDN